MTVGQLLDDGCSGARRMWEVRPLLFSRERTLGFRGSGPSIGRIACLAFPRWDD